jgi:16S rRNA (guanine1516-N2)-methyltransferase
MASSFLEAMQRRRLDTQMPSRAHVATTLLRCVVTTGNDRDVGASDRSQALAARLDGHQIGSSSVLHAAWQSRYFTSSRPMTLTKMMTEQNAAAVLVVDGSGVHLKLRDDGGEFKLHGGLGVLRVRCVLSGGNDALCSACDLRAGDVFVDGTAGQLQDSLVAAAAVGPSGRVVAIEASPLLWAVTAARPTFTGDDEIDRLLNDRIEVRLGEASAVLAQMPTASADVVYFDPMWVKPSKSSASFEVLRTLAHSERLGSEAISEACRVARRAVVVMDQRGGAELERLGLSVVAEGQRKRYGLIRIQSS